MNHSNADIVYQMGLIADMDYHVQDPNAQPYTQVAYHNGTQIQIQIIPFKLDYALSDDYQQEEMIIQSGDVGMSMLARDNNSGELRYMVEAPQVGTKFASAEDYIEMDFAVGKYSGAGDGRSCSNFVTEPEHYVLNQQVHCLGIQKMGVAKCLKKYMHTLGQKWVTREAAASRQASASGRRRGILPMNGEDAVRYGTELVNRHLAIAMLNNARQRASNVQNGDVLGNNSLDTIFDGIPKLLWHQRKSNYTNETVLFEPLRMTADMQIIIVMGADLETVPFDTDIATTVTAAIAKINSMTDSTTGAYPMQASYHTNEDGTIDATKFVVSSTDPRRPLPIEPIRVGWTNPAAKAATNAEVTSVLLIPFTRNFSPIHIPYHGTQTPADKVTALIKDWDRLVIDNPMFSSSLLSTMIMHVSKSEARALAEGYNVLTPTQNTFADNLFIARPMTQALAALAERLMIAEIHIDPTAKGDNWFCTYRENVEFGFNVNPDNNGVNVFVGAAGTHRRDFKTGKLVSIEGKLVIDTESWWGVRPLRYHHIITNICETAECTAPLRIRYREIDPECTNSKPLDNVGSVMMFN